MDCNNQIWTFINCKFVLNFTNRNKKNTIHCRSFHAWRANIWFSSLSNDKVIFKKREKKKKKKELVCSVWSSHFILGSHISTSLSADLSCLKGQASPWCMWILNLFCSYYSHLSLCLYVFDFSDMKNAVIGNNKQKSNLIVLGAVPRYSSPHFILLIILTILIIITIIVLSL